MVSNSDLVLLTQLTFFGASVTEAERGNPSGGPGGGGQK